MDVKKLLLVVLCVFAFAISGCQSPQRQQFDLLRFVDEQNFNYPQCGGGAIEEICNASPQSDDLLRIRFPQNTVSEVGVIKSALIYRIFDGAYVVIRTDFLGSEESEKWLIERLAPFWGEPVDDRRRHGDRSLRWDSKEGYSEVSFEREGQAVRVTFIVRSK